MKNLLAVLLLCGSALAQSYTTVSATLQDSTGQVWANASWTTEFSKPPGNNGNFNNGGQPITPNQTGTANASGVFTVTLDDNLVVAPGGSSWKFTICPNASVASCNVVNLTIFGPTMDVSGQLNAVLSIPVVNAAPVIAHAYNDHEVNGSYGTLYINSIDNTLRECLVLQCLGSGWVAISASTLNPTFLGTLSVPCVKFNTTIPTDDTTVCGQPGVGHINISLPATGGTLALTGSAGNVSNSGTPLIHQVSVWVDATHIQGVANAIAGNCFMSNGLLNDPSFQTCPLNVSGTPLNHQIASFTAANTVQGISPTSNTGWVLTSNGLGSDPSFQALAGGGNVSNTGTPLNHQVAIWTNATTIQGLTPSTSGFVLTSNGTGADPTFQAPSGGSGFPVPSGTMHSFVFNNSTTLSSSSGNNYPAGLWSHLGGTFVVNTNVASSNQPPNYKSATNGGTGGISSSIAEDGIAQQATFNIWQAYACYCEVEVGGEHIVWMVMSNQLYGNLVHENPNGVIWGFRYDGEVDTNFQAYVGTASGTFTKVDTGIAVNPLAWHGFAMNKNGSGGIDFYIDNAKVATISSGATGFPTATTPVYAITLSGLLNTSIDLSLFINSIRWWTIY